MAINALIHEKSPYLRQHAHNPVDWLPWGEAAFAKARTEDKPIFLSIGYSTCHWCHVMAHESFENEAIAVVLNRDYVPIKIDREERPDVDRIYMLFVQASTGSGGWPMSVWLTPDLKPFFGGTYFPPDSRYGRPGFKDVLDYLARAWREERARVESSGAGVLEQLRTMGGEVQPASELDRALFESPYLQFRRMFDAKWGGFGGAPKFPRPVVLHYLVRFYAAGGGEEALDMVTETLDKMAAGGMHDQLGGGFHRYSVDERWFVPHFEKMLYDQAQLAMAYLETYQITGEKRLAAVAQDILSYVQRDLSDDAGGFYSAEDADSPDPSHSGRAAEGAFYIWTQAEIEQHIGKPMGAVFDRRYGVLPEGNVENDPQGEFAGRNILYEAMPKREAGARAGLEESQTTELLVRASKTLFAAREERPRPHLDAKVLTSWNGLMISAFAKAFAVLGDEEYKEAACKAADFLLSRMYDRNSGQLLRRYFEGDAAIDGFIDDYAFLAQALCDLFSITFEMRYVETALDLVNRGFKRFEDAVSGGFFSTSEYAPDLLLRMKDEYDGAEPSGNSVATAVLVRLAHLKGDADLEARARKALAWAAPKLKAQPTAAPLLSATLAQMLAAPAHTVIRCKKIDGAVLELVKTEWKKFEPNVAVLVISDDSAQGFSNWAAVKETLERRGTITIYRCKNFTCELPEVIP